MDNELDNKQDVISVSSNITINRLVDDIYDYDYDNMDDECFEENGFFDFIDKINNMTLSSLEIADKSCVDDDAKSTQTDKTILFELSEDDEIEIEMLVYELIGDYMDENIDTLCKIDYDDTMCDHITELVYEYCKECGICEDDDEHLLREYVDKMIVRFFETHRDVLPRSYKSSLLCDAWCTEADLTTKLDALKNVYQPPQKTDEWYSTRHAIITASSLWKVFASEGVQNGLIYEKCKPYVRDYRREHDNVLSALHWGNKYEPVTLMLYEKMYETRVGAFGCITHPKYAFIGASPDGINVAPGNPRYGRMVEVKNIFNREITGIPKEEYWIQMQIQMETCDLDECDFIETRFKEYENEEAFYADEWDPTKTRGVILYFVQRINDLKVINNNPHYVYMPMDTGLEKESIDGWIQKTKDELKDSYILYQAQYWWLDQVSCVLVKRNREWFDWAIQKIQDVWDTIEREKVSGYEHRAPKKKETVLPEVLHSDGNSTQLIKNLEYGKSVCLVKLDENGDPV